MPRGKTKYSGPPGGGPKKKRKKKRYTTSSAVSGASTNDDGLLGSSQKVNFIYAESFNVVNGGTYVYSLNGCYDPDITGIGHQPRGFDQMMQLYDHGVVINTKVEVWMVTENGPAIMNVAVRDSVTPALSTQDYLEQGNVDNIALGRNGYEPGYSVFNVNPNKFLGRSKPLADTDLKFNTTANPKEGCFLHVHNRNFGTVNNDTVDCFIRLTYTTILIEPKVPVSS